MTMTAERPPPLKGGFSSELAIIGRTATTWDTTAPLIWTGTEGDTFTVPAGFTTDFATVPRFLHWLWLPYGGYTRAAVLHDYLLWLLAQARRQGLKPPVTSRDADAIFRVVMQDLEVRWLKRWTGWTAVRWASLFNRDRAYGRDFHKDAPKVLGMTLLIVVGSFGLIPIACVAVLIALGFIEVANVVVGLFVREGRTPRRRSRRSSIPPGSTINATHESLEGEAP